MFVASDKHVRLQCDSYLKVSCKDYLVASYKRVSLLFGSWLRNTTLLQNDGALLSGPQRNALASLVHFANNVN